MKIQVTLQKMKQLARAAVSDGMSYEQFCIFMSMALINKPSLKEIDAAFQKDGIKAIFQEVKDESV